MSNNRFDSILSDDGYIDIDLYNSENIKIAYYNSVDNAILVSPEYDDRKVESIDSLFEIFEKELSKKCVRFVVSVGIRDTDTWAKFDSENNATTYGKCGIHSNNQTGDQELTFMRLFRQIGKSLKIKIPTILSTPMINTNLLLP